MPRQPTPTEKRGGPFHKTLRAAEQDRPDVAARRRIWRAAQPFVDADKLVFIDETGASTKMTRLYGRAPRGRRLLAKAPFGHWKTTTFVAALRKGSLDAPMVLDGPMTGQAFLAYVEQVLIPTLEPDDIVVVNGHRSFRRSGRLKFPGLAMAFCVGDQP